MSINQTSTLGDMRADAPAPSPVPIGSAAARRLAPYSGLSMRLSASGRYPAVSLILLNLKTASPGQRSRELAEAAGVREAMLTIHLNAMARRGWSYLGTRDAADPRVEVGCVDRSGRRGVRAPAGHCDRLRRQAAGGPRRRRPGDAQYPAPPPTRQRWRGGSCTALGRPARPPPRVTDLAATFATRRPRPDPALTGQRTTPAGATRQSPTRSTRAVAGLRGDPRRGRRTNGDRHDSRPARWAARPRRASVSTWRHPLAGVLRCAGLGDDV